MAFTGVVPSGVKLGLVLNSPFSSLRSLPAGPSAIGYETREEEALTRMGGRRRLLIALKGPRTSGVSLVTWLTGSLQIFVPIDFISTTLFLTAFEPFPRFFGG